MLYNKRHVHTKFNFLGATENLKNIISPEPWNLLIIKHLNSFKCRQLSGRALTPTLTCMRPWGFNTSMMFPSSPKSKYFTLGEEWWHMPTILVLKRERQVSIQFKVKNNSKNSTVLLESFNHSQQCFKVLWPMTDWLRSPWVTRRPEFLPSSIPPASAFQVLELQDVSLWLLH